MFARGKPKDGSRKVTPPSPSYMSNDQFASYLAGLRNNRVNRPTGARPPPPPASTSRRDSARLSIGAGRPSMSSLPPSEASSVQQPSQPATPSVAGRPSFTASHSSRYSTLTQTKDYIPDKPAAVKPLKPSEVVPSSRYIERGSRWMEKEEAVALRQAMEDMDLRDELKALPKNEPEDEDERRLYNAALDEAAELVWQHQNPGKVPPPGGPYRYKPHLRKNSYQHARTASAGLYGEDVTPTGLARDPMTRSASASSGSSDGHGSTESRTSATYSGRQSGEHGTPRHSIEGVGRSASTESKTGKSYGGIASGGTFVAPSHRRRSSMKRNISGEVEKPFSGDQIWEEPESLTNTPQRKAAAKDTGKREPEVEPLSARPRNPPNRVQFTPKMAPVADSPPSSPSKNLLSRTEIHRNPPSQSRNPQYTKTDTAAAAPAPVQDSVPRIQGVEVRSEDIRKATSMTLADRSAKLPTPSAVSDTPGRPIVSFDKNWRPAEEVAADKKVVPEDVPKSSAAAATGGAAAATKAIKFARRNPFARRGHNNNDQAQAQPLPQPLAQPQYQPQIQAQEGQHHQRAFQQDRKKEAVVPIIAVEEVAPAKGPAPGARGPPPSIQINSASLPPIPSIAVCDADSRSHGHTKNNTPAPPIPTIVLPGGDDDSYDDTPSAPGIPIIVTPDDNPSITTTPPTAATTTTSPTKPSARPLPTPGSNPHPHRRGHWSSAPAPPPTSNTTASRSTALCAECFQPIVGRFVSLGGVSARFHPGCFRCYTCGTPLEALEISPEPDSHRAERLARIQARLAGHALPEDEDDRSGKTARDDGDDRMRFYCHLDWHELFAPRCGHCTTPIHGEHVFALGRHWHFGHFFCAECGDPFERGMTHIEKDGYAWCVGCQTKRTERRAPKCRACRRPVVGSYVRALGGEWHEDCFRCAGCAGGFVDGQVFPVDGRGVVCTGCRARELKA